MKKRSGGILAVQTFFKTKIESNHMQDIPSIRDNLQGASLSSIL